MIINVMCGGKAKDFATTGGVATPSYHKVRLSCELAFYFNKTSYEKKAIVYKAW